MARISNLPELRKNNRTVQDVKQERDSGKARLLNFGTKHAVEMAWGMNQDTIDDQIFILKIGDNEAWLSAEEMQRFLRWV